MEGLLPLSEAIKKYLNAKYPDRDDLYIGLDIAVAVGNPAIISTALLLTPISVFIAFALPGNEVLPLGDLANLAVMASMIALASRGNIFRTVLAAIPVIIADLWIATKIAPFITGMAKDVNFKFAEGSSGQVSSFLDGGNPFRFWLLEIFNDDIPVFIPHLRGSGSPYKNRHTRGLFYGLGDTLNIDILIASVSLGLTMEFANCFACFNVPGTSALKVIGPATHNPLWLQLKADILQRPVEAIAFNEAVSVGALLTAAPDIPPPPVAIAQRLLPNRARYHQLQRYQHKWKSWYQLKLQQEGVGISKKRRRGRCV